LIAARYLRAYQRESSIDLANQGYYEALRCAVELSWVANYRIAQATLHTHDVPRPIWDAIADYMVDYFRARTGVTLQLPARPSNS
jgi:hypothetical protein